jgi:hypothetical protein
MLSDQESGRGTLRLVSIFLALSTFAPLTAMAANDRPWEPGWSVVPYGWLAGFDGEIGVNSAGLDPGGGLGLADLVEFSTDGELEEIGFMLYAAWRGERWSAAVDSVWANVKQDAKLVLRGLLPDSSLRLTIDGNIYHATLGYLLSETERSALVAYGGARYYDVELVVDASGGLLPSPVSASGSTQWLDATAGLRWTYRPSPRWDITALADFGAGDSDASWQVFATIGYHFSWGAIRAGYRRLDVDYQSGDYVLDAALEGPLVGVAFQF